MSPASLIEEQLLPRFHEKRFYPVKIGQTFKDKYRVVAKMGYGAYSTVWLARDQTTNQYAALKICIRSDDSDESPVKNELKVLERMASRQTDHPGSQFARHMHDHFRIDGHDCMVMSPQACSLQQLSDIYASNGIPEFVITAVVTNLLTCLNWCQLQSGIVHTDISAANILLTATSDVIFERAEQEEVNSPSVPVTDQAHPHPHPVYPSRVKPANLLEAVGGSVLNDFGSARLLDVGRSTRGWSMPDIYRAPEVLMDLPWDHGVDVWSLGVMLLELVEGRNLFDPIDRANNQYVLPLAIAQYIGLMGLPPVWMIQQSGNPIIKTFFDEQGRWTADLPIQTLHLDDFVRTMPPGEEKQRFISFIRRILTWDPSVRANTSELFEDEWITEALSAMKNQTVA